ncbi:MAG: Calx-beta domain-containing protein [Verrucomicrobiota bacterium]
MKKSLINSLTQGLAIALAFTSFSFVAKAVPYASAVTESGGNVSFILNESGAGVKVVFSGPASTLDLGTLSKGLQTFPRGAATAYQIEVTKSVAPVWTQISTDTNQFNLYFSPGGIAVNRNPTNLALFGRAYVAENVGGLATTVGTRTVQEGIYVINADQSDALAQGDIAKTAGITFDPGTASAGPGPKSPWKIEVGADNNLYIADFTTNLGTIYQTDPDVITSTVVLSGIGSTVNPTVHTSCNGSPIVKGSTALGNLQVWAIDGQWAEAGGRNSLLRWDINGTALPYNSAPVVLGSAGNSSVNDVQSDLDIAPDGKFFLSQNRANGTANVYDATRVNVRIYATDGTTLLWDSLAQSLASGLQFDVLVGARSIKVSPDGKKMAVARNDTKTWIVDLTNGVPDLTKTNLLDTFNLTSTSTSNRREVAFDAAGNLWVGNNSKEVVRVWSPGGTTTTITRSAGTFSIVVPATEVSITAPDATASEALSNTGTITVTRAGDTSAALAIPYTITGTASNGVDYTTLSGTVTFAAGATSTNITISPIDDSIAEVSETVILTFSSGTNYSILAPFNATVTILDNETPELSVAAIQPILLECYAGSKATLQVIRKGDLAPALTANLVYSGAAVRGTDFNGPLSVTIDAGATSTNFILTPIADAIYEANETAVCSAATGTGYTVGVGSGTVTILDGDSAPAPVLFSDNFDTDTSVNWITNAADGGLDTFVEFFYDYSADGIPPAPHSGGTTRGVKFRVNETQGLVNGISISPIGQNFTNDYRLEFDLWINVNGPFPDGGTGSTEYGNAGIGTSGAQAQWEFGTPDGAWFSADGDGGTGVATGDYNAYYGSTKAPDASGAYVAGTAAGVRENFNPFYSLWGGDSAPASQLAAHPQQTGALSVGTYGLAWHCVAITKVGETVNWSIDGKSIANLTNDVSTPFTTTGNIFIGYMDRFASLSDNPALSFGLFDNVEVVNLSAPVTPVITGIQIVSGNVEITFSGGTSDSAASFKLQNSLLVTGGYADNNSAAITQLSPGVFKATIATAGATQFYRIRRL